MQYSSDLLAPLTGLGSLLQLCLLPSNDTAEGLEVVCELTGLKWLDLIDAPVGAGEQLLQLTQLQQLTYLNYLGVVDGQHCKEQLIQVGCCMYFQQQKVFLHLQLCWLCQQA